MSPRPGVSLMPMARQCRDAVAWVFKNAASFGGNPNRIYPSGHSSGAHLACVVLVTDWEKQYGLPKDVVKGGLLCSGMFDLKAVRPSAHSSYVNFGDDVEHDLSSQRHLHKLNAPVIVAFGTLETPEFQRQSREFAAAVRITLRDHRDARQSLRTPRSRRPGADETAGVIPR